MDTGPQARETQMIKGLLTFVAIVTLLTLAFAFAVAHGEDAPQFQPVYALVIDVNHMPQELVFEDANGMHRTITVEACGKSATCRAIFETLHAAGKTEYVDVVTGTDI